MSLVWLYSQLINKLAENILKENALNIYSR